MVGRQRLRVGDVERGAQPAGAQLGEQRVGVDDGSAGDVDEQRAVWHPGQERGVDQAAGLVGERHGEDHDIGLRQQAGQLVDAVDTRRRARRARPA